MSRTTTGRELPPVVQLWVGLRSHGSFTLEFREDADRGAILRLEGPLTAEAVRREGTSEEIRDEAVRLLDLAVQRGWRSREGVAQNKREITQKFRSARQSHRRIGDA
jgi:hypothetical protein